MSIEAREVEQSAVGWVPEVNLALRFRMVRQKRGWTQKELADQTGFSSGSIANWELGVRPQNLDQVVQRYARATGCSPYWLMWGWGEFGADPQNLKPLARRHDRRSEPRLGPEFRVGACFSS